jgi:hypothetical protein
LQAERLFGNIDERYYALSKAYINTNSLSSVYNGHLDSLTTSLKFLQTSQQLPGLENTLTTYGNLQTQFNKADQLSKYFSDRQRFLREELGKLGMLKELKSFQQQAYYYQSQFKEYKNVFAEPAKAEQKLLELVQKTPQFKEFFANNSMLGSLFALPGRSVAGPSLPGIQTRASIEKDLLTRFGNSGEAGQMLQQQMQSAQGELNALKNKINSASNGSVGSAGDAASFKPNSQKTKSFLKRLEIGFNVQSSGTTYFLPAKSDLGISVGYKINDKSSVGIGVAYALGWGRGWDHIRLSSEGLGLRSYFDMRLKGSFYLTGGYEMNYCSSFSSIDQLKDQSAWQQSGLAGLAKKFKIKGKARADMRLLWDFLSYSQEPRSKPVLFRIGYQF